MRDSAFILTVLQQKGKRTKVPSRREAEHTLKYMKWINTAAFAVMILVNALANLIPIGGKTTGEISEAYPNLFTPAPISFSIWGVIYLLMLGFVLYQWELFDFGTYSSVHREQIGLMFFFSCVLNTLWILLWHTDSIYFSSISIIMLLVSLALIVLNTDRKNIPVVGRLFVNAGFDIYFGWIIAATIANISVCLTKAGWNGFGLPEEFWTVVVILAGTGIAYAAVSVSHLHLSACAVIWAYIGILIKHISKDGYAGEYRYVIIAAIAGIIIILIAITRDMIISENACVCSIKAGSHAE